MVTRHAAFGRDVIDAHTRTQSWFRGILERGKLWSCVASAKRTGGEASGWFRFWYWFEAKDYSSYGGWIAYYAANADKLARAIRKMEALPRDLSERLEALRTAKDEAFLVVRGVFARRRWYQLYSCKRIEREPLSNRGEPRDSRWFITRYTNDLIATTMLDALGVMHRPKNGILTKVMFRDYMTVPGVERDQYTKDFDVPLRFRTIDPELHFSGEPVPAHELAPRYLIFLCVENPLRESILLLPVKYVLDHLGRSAQEHLRESNFEVFDHWDPTLTQMVGHRFKALLGGAVDDPWAAELSLDVNRINPTQVATTPRHKGALSDLRKAMTEAGSKALEVVLRPGDALIVDNHRVLVRRAESKAAGSHRWWRRELRTTRWIRLYAGFPRSAVSPEPKRPSPPTLPP
jgi:hypothetical protein